MTKSTGYTFLEVMISLLLFSLILLGFNAMQMQALQETQEAYYYTVAALQWNAMADRLRALDKQAGLDNQIKIWNNENKILLNAKGEVIGQYPSYTIKLNWGQNKSLISTLKIN